EKSKHAVLPMPKPDWKGWLRWPTGPCMPNAHGLMSCANGVLPLRAWPTSTPRVMRPTRSGAVPTSTTAMHCRPCGSRNLKSMMSRQPSDSHVRAQALDPAQSFLIQAPAGSGKTELLTDRILALLATVSQPEEIVAITFTRKAASEMHARVMSKLQAGAGPAPQEAHRVRS